MDKIQNLGPKPADAGKTELLRKLAGAIPQGIELKYYHVSSPPTPCPALFAAPPGLMPETTFCESHFVNFTVPKIDAQASDAEVAIFAIEVLIYHTAKLTTIFVSKADSTGYVSLIKLPKQQPSLVQALTSEFLLWLVQNRQRTDRKLVVSLFARAQDQYLFPGSIENGKKHVLDDRGLVKWWCKTLDPVIRQFDMEDNHPENGTVAHDNPTSRGYLVVPGQDKNETAAFFPSSFRSDSANKKRWANAHPLLRLTDYPSAPPRCLIPHFPDDPKARYLAELDDELPDRVKAAKPCSNSVAKSSNSVWKSIKSLDQFWEMMAYRQECSSGRLVGFFWVTITPCWPLQPSPDPVPSITQPVFVPPPPRKVAYSKLFRKISMKTRKGPIHSRTPRIKHTEPTAITDPNYRLSASSVDPDFSRFSFTSGNCLIEAKAYDRLNEYLLCLDFANLDIAALSTRKWVNEMGVCAGIDCRAALACGISLTGMRNPTEDRINDIGLTGGGENVLPVKRKKKAEDSEADAVPDMGVNTLGTGLVRKKPKVATS